MMVGGKQIYFWDYANFQAAGISLSELTAYIAGLGVDAVAVKMANGTLAYTGLRDVVNAIRQAGVVVGGWHYYYCGVRFRKDGSYYLTNNTPAQEAQASVTAMDLYEPAFWIEDIEQEFKVWEQVRRADELQDALLPAALERNIPVGLSSYRYPYAHMAIPWGSFFRRAGGVSFNYPQVYWNPPSGGQYGPVPETQRSFSEYERLYRELGVVPRPFIPAGRAYVGDGYPVPGPSAAELTDWMQFCKDAGFPGISFWGADALVRHPGGSERASAISQFGWGDGAPVPPPQPAPAKFTVAVSGCNIRREPSTAAGQATVIGNGKLGGRWDIEATEKGSDGFTWYRVSGWVREDMGNASA